MTNHRYILDSQGNPVIEPDLLKWAAWFEDDNNRRVARTHIGKQTVSTVFLSLDHRFGIGPPVLWETMVFPENEPMERCSGNREQAEAMHAAMVARIQNP